MVQVVLGLTENSVLMYGKGFNPRLPKFMNADMNPLGRKETKRKPFMYVKLLFLTQKYACN